MALFSSSAGSGWSKDFPQVLDEELKLTGISPGGTAGDALQRARDARLVGVSFSGGGIRSATFNLGVLQALARYRLLDRVHYLSTVSGGGYIGSWLMTWLQRRQMENVQRGLSPAWREQATEGKEEAPEVRALRRYSNYLTPRLGWFGADLWTVIAIYARNLLLNLIVLVCTLSVLLLAPRWIASEMEKVALGHWLSWQWLVFLGVILASVGVYYRSASRVGWTVVGLIPLAAAVGGSHLAVYLGAPAEVLMWAPAAVALAGVSICSVANMHAFRTRSEVKADGALNPRDAGVDDLFHADAKWLDAKTGRPERPEQVKAGLAAADLSEWATYDADLQNFRLKLEFKMENKFDWPDLALSGNGRSVPPTEGVPAQSFTGAAWEAVARPDETNTLELSCEEGMVTLRANGRTMHQERRCMGKRVRLSLRKRRAGYEWLWLRKFESNDVLWYTQDGIQLFAVLPTVIASVLAVLALLSRQINLEAGLAAKPLYPASFGVGLAVGAGCLAAGGLWHAYRKYLGAKVRRDLPVLPDIGILMFPVAAGLTACGVVWIVTLCTNPWRAVTLGPPLMMACVSVGVMLFLGLMGRSYDDDIREWWSRVTAWLLIAAVTWLGLFGVSLYLPPVMRWAAAAGTAKLAAAGIGWVISTIGGLLAAKSSATGKPQASPAKEWIAGVAPYIFVIGLFALLAWGLDSALVDKKALSEESQTVAGLSVRLADYVHGQEQRLLDTVADTSVAWALVAAAGIAFGLSALMNINEFSMHMLYRNRLVRCYLGATNEGPRRPHPFTGFDPSDDYQLKELKKVFEENKRRADDKRPAPYPILNAALNLASGSELEWQQRKAASFVFTPAYCGYDFADQPPGYVETEKYAGGNFSVGTAMAISGAAASPNSGYHTSPAPAFLMTVFNVRLGWWTGNTRHELGHGKASPALLLFHLLRELFGLTNAADRYVYLSDGGHFENLGIYELVRRRCRYILACDAEEDGEFVFDALGSAVEKCRADFGIEIDIDVDAIRKRNAEKLSKWHCAVGTIRYDTADPEGENGILIYIKSSLTGDETADILRYRDANPEFPHQSTADQWFDETQFESYRRLGLHVLDRVVGPAYDGTSKDRTLTVEQLFHDLQQRWQAPAEVATRNFSAQARELVNLFREMRDNPALEYLTWEMYPQWRQFEPVRKALKIMQAGRAPRSPDEPQAWLRQDVKQLRDGFYTCNAMIQLMENVYNDLRLESQHAHPDHRGWMNLFRHWSWSEMFRVTWTICASTYGARFQSFCEMHLDLRIGYVLPLDNGISVEDALSAQNNGAELNAVERELIRLFFEKHGPRNGRERVFLLRLTPEEDLRKRTDAPVFTFGFMLGMWNAQTVVPPTLQQLEVGYVRVQDHLRHMGLARRFIEGLEADSGLDFAVVPRAMSDLAHEVPTKQELERFRRYCEEVRLAARAQRETGKTIQLS